MAAPGLCRLAGWLCSLIGVTCFGAFAFVVVIAVSTGVSLFAFLAELSSQAAPPLKGQVSNLVIQSVCDLSHASRPEVSSPA